MIRRRWIQATADIELLEKQVLGFYGADSLDDLAAKIPNALRKSTSYLKETASERFWLQRVKQLAPAAPVSAKFTDALFVKAMNRFKGLLGHPESVRHIPKVLADAGIRLSLSKIFRVQGSTEFACGSINFLPLSHFLSFGIAWILCGSPSSMKWIT